jgi:hypothetical protein
VFSRLRKSNIQRLNQPLALYPGAVKLGLQCLAGSAALDSVGHVVDVLFDGGELSLDGPASPAAGSIRAPGERESPAQ